MAEGGADVTVLCRHAICEAVKSHGLRVRKADGRRIESKVEAVEKLPDNGAFDWIFVTVKAFDVEKSLCELEAAGLLGERTRVMGFQNGVGTEELIARAVPGRSAVCSVTRVIAFTDDPGEVLEAKPVGGIAIAPFDRGEPAFGDLEPVLSRCGLEVQRFEDYRVMKWSKLVLNMTANAICAILDCSPSELYSSRALFEVEHNAFEEATAVMRAMGVRAHDLPGYPAAKLSFVMNKLPWRLARHLVAYGVGHGRGSKQPSLRLEMDRARPESEVEWLNGAVVQHAARLGLKAPTHEFLTSTLVDILHKRLPWETYRHKPDAFLEAYHNALGAPSVR